jgi:catechol 2,3-dioxygenase-like lactoylglutathione lyase family enzyme
MGLELYMVGVVVEDMARALEFYRRLGVEIPEGSEAKHHVEIKMSGLTFFITTKTLNARWDPARTEASGGYRMILEFYLETQKAVDEKYAEMIGYGYESHYAPYVTPFGIYFALINDPDGNTILLSGELTKENEKA